MQTMRSLALALAIFAGIESLVTTAAPLYAAEPEWKLGLAEVKITPERPLALAGYASRNHPFEKVTTDLYAKALALEDRDGHVGVIVTTDLIGLTAANAEPFCDGLPAKTGLRGGKMLLRPSHTDTGPVVTVDLKERESKTSSDDQQR